MAAKTLNQSFLKTPLGHVVLVAVGFSFLFLIFFSPVIFTGRLLAPGGGRLGDGLLYHLTYFLSNKALWDPLLANGFPMIADPQVMAWYPPALLLSQIPGAWNVFVVSAYVMASCFAYGYAFSITRSRFAAVIAGIAYGMCGFMMAHLGHTAMIHTAVWLPLIVWSLEKLRDRISSSWLIIGCAAVTCCILAGHLQIVTYTLLLSALYGLFAGWSAPVGRLRFYSVTTLIFVLGLGLASLQILPTIELAGLSTRVIYSYTEFVTYSLPFSHLILMLFPAVLGGLQRYGPTPYFGQWNLTEMTGYVGLLPLVLAGAGATVSLRNRVAGFWLIAGLVSLLLALGDQTPLAYITYRLPALGKFRAPARHLIELSFAVSVLAAIGTQAIVQHQIKRRTLLLLILVPAGIISAVGAGITSERVATYAASMGVATLPAPLSNPAIWVPVLLFTVGAAALFFWHRSPSSLLLKSVLGLVLVLDLASFGWFYSWHDYAPHQDILNSPAIAARYREELRQSNQRILSVRGTLGMANELPPNLSRIWDVPNATGYSPLMLNRVADLLTMLPDGGVAPRWKEHGEQGFNLAAARYIFFPKAELRRDLHGVSWNTDNMDLWLGSGCDRATSKSLRFSLPRTVAASGIGLVSRLACSSSIPNGTEVARLVVTDSAGVAHTNVIVAGRDTSEWAYDCPAVKPAMKHDRADVFESFPAKMYDEPCEGHFYRTIVDFKAIKDVRQIEIEWLGGTGAMTIDKLSLIQAQGETSVPVDSFSIENSPWKLVEETAGVRVYENSQAMPRAWLVGSVATLRPEEILQAIKTSRLPGGHSYDPSRQALIEEPSTLTQQINFMGAARVTALNNTTMSVSTSSDAAAFLVTSDSFYPGWEASVDGKPAKLFRTNYALRGVEVPAGQHLVTFEFKPKTFYYGVILSLISFLALIASAGILLRSGVKREGSPKTA